MVLRFLNSLERTTKHKDRIEVLFAIDTGKTEIIDHVWREGYSFDITFYERDKTVDFTNCYYNYLANHSVGKNIIAFNDDAWMRTQDWDVKIMREIKAYGWSVYMCDIPDTARLKYGHKFPCFPCVSRRAVNTLGWLLCKDVRIYPADNLTHAVYNEIKRVIPIRDVLVEHEHVLESDESKARMMEIFNEDMKKNIDLTEYIMKLAVLSGTENNKKYSKINRIVNILQER